MGDFKTLSEEMEKLQKQIDNLFYISDYQEYDDLSGLSDYMQINTPDQRQLLEEYRNILYRLEDIKETFHFLARPILEVGTLHINSQGRYETDSGYYYTSGTRIEFLRTDEVYNHDTDKWESIKTWTASRVESEGGNYFIVGYPDLDMSRITVRVRK
ncbi:DUF5348 domain-containing protein [bacterium]|nr:DUF5348 domain-containing protein [bacterium]